MCCVCERNSEWCVSVPVAIATMRLPLALLLELELLLLLLPPVVAIVGACACQSQRHSSHPSHYTDNFPYSRVRRRTYNEYVYYNINSDQTKRLFYASYCCRWFCCCVGFVFISIYGIDIRIVCLAK